MILSSNNKEEISCFSNLTYQFFIGMKVKKWGESGESC